MVQASTTPVTVRLELLGVPRVVLGGSTNHALERKDAALLAMLALEGNGARAHLSAMLWPDADADKARNNLRQRLFRLRRLAGQDLVTAGDTLALAAGVEHDLAEIDDPENSAARSELLGTLDYDDCGALADWVAAARGHWRKRHRAALEERAERLEREGRLAAALICADRLVADNPIAEDGVRRLMRLHALRGDRAAALAVLQKLQETLARDLGTRAAASTQALAVQIESGVAVPGGRQAPRPVILRPPRLIGRDLEWRRLELAWHSARSTIVLGEPGMGKSRLLGEFAATRGDALSNAARSGDDAIAYALLARLVRSLVARYDSPSIPWVRAELARLAPELGTAPSGALDAIRLVNALSHLVRHARGAGLAGLVIDDLHYADDASLEGLIALAGQDGVRGLPVVGGTRASEEPRILREWRAAGAAGDICLQPLTRDGVGALLGSLALPDFDPEQWVEPMFRHTGGNPLFVLETLRAILAGGALPTAVLPAPASVGELIGRRLAQLPAPALDLARVAAFAGQDFSAALASTVLRKHALDIADAWRELESAQILRDGAFAHDLILEATLHGAPEDEAAHLHRSIAAYLESQDAPAARVAGHWHAASEWPHAARQFDAAARAQFNASRYIEAGELFRRAAACFELAGAQAECHAALQELAGCQIKAFDLTAARAVVQQLQRIAITDEQQGWALDRLADILNMSREDDRAAQEAAREMQQRGHTTGKPWMIFNATRKLAVAFAHQAQYDAALVLFDTQTEWVQENLHEWNVHVWFCDRGFVLDLADRRAEAVAAFLRAEMLARKHENWAVAYAALRNLAFTHLWAGRVDTAVRTSDQAVGFSSRLGEALVERNPRDAARRGALLRDAGRLSESHSLLHTAHATLARGGSPYWLAYCEDQLALLYALLGQPARARDLLARQLGPLPPESRLSRWIVQSRLARAQGHAPVPWAQAQAQSASDPMCPTRWRLLALLEHTRSLDVAPALEKCAAIAAEAGSHELGGIELAAQGLAAARATAANMAGVASEAALRAHELAETMWPVGVSVPEFCVGIVRALAAAGEAKAARQATDRAVHWIEVQALPNVPAEFRDSFLNRNPVHRAVLTGIGRGRAPLTPR